MIIRWAHSKAHTRSDSSFWTREIESPSIQCDHSSHRISHFSCTKRRTLETSLSKQYWDTASCATIPCISEHRVLPQNGFITMISSRNKCLDIGGNYIEKWSNLYSSWCHGVFAFGNKVSTWKKQWIFSDFSENFLNFSS